MKLNHYLSALIVALVTLPASGLFAQETAVQENIDYKTIIADYIEATGGETAHKAITSITAKGTMSIPAAGVEGKVLTVASDGKGYMKISLGGLGDTIIGCDGDTVWKISDITGAEIIEGEPRDQMLRQMAVSPLLSIEKNYDSIECTGTEEFAGEQCYVGVMKKGDQAPEYNYFSVESRLLLGGRMTQSDPMVGKMEIVSKQSDYKEVSGVKMSHSTTIELPTGMSMITEIETYEANGEIDKSLFEIPDAIKELKEDK